MKQRLQVMESVWRSEVVHRTAERKYEAFNAVNGVQELDMDISATVENRKHQMGSSLRSSSGASKRAASVKKGMIVERRTTYE